jgi:hypothetical protein
MVIAGCFLGENDNIAWVIQPGDSSVPQPEPMYYSNAEEADIRKPAISIHILNHTCMACNFIIKNLHA